MENEEKERIKKYQEFFNKDLGNKPYQLVLTFQKDETQFSSVVVSNADWNNASFNTIRGLISGLTAAVNNIMKNAFPEIKIAQGTKPPEEAQYR